MVKNVHHSKHIKKQQNRLRRYSEYLRVIGVISTYDSGLGISGTYKRKFVSERNSVDIDKSNEIIR